MIVISVYKVVCNYCGEITYKAIEENLLHPEDKSEHTELRCNYCGRIIKEAELIERKCYEVSNGVKY